MGSSSIPVSILTIPLHQWVLNFQFNSVQSLSSVRLFATPWTAVCQASLTITNSRSLLKLMSIKLVMASNHLCLELYWAFIPQHLLIPLIPWKLLLQDHCVRMDRVNSARGFFGNSTCEICAILQHVCNSVKSFQSYPTACNPMYCSLPGSSVHGILQAKILEWVAISFSRGSSQPRDWTCVSYVSCIGRQVLYQ